MNNEKDANKNQTGMEEDRFMLAARQVINMPKIIDMNRFPVEDIEKIKGLTEKEMEYAQLYGEYINFTHHKWLRSKGQEHRSLEEKRKIMYVNLENLEESIGNKNIIFKLMMLVEELFDTPLIQAVRNSR